MHVLGLRLCGFGMLTALGAGIGGYFLEPSLVVFVLAGVAAVVGTVGIGLLGFQFLTAREH